MPRVQSSYLSTSNSLSLYYFWLLGNQNGLYTTSWSWPPKNTWEKWSPSIQNGWSSSRQLSTNSPTKINSVNARRNRGSNPYITGNVLNFCKYSQFLFRFTFKFQMELNGYGKLLLGLSYRRMNLSALLSMIKSSSVSFIL